jgi:hypothetical protein
MLPTTRSYGKLFLKGLEPSNSGVSFTSETDYTFYNYNSAGGITDNRINARQITNVAMNDALFIGIYSRIEELINLSGYQVYEIDKASGSLKISRAAVAYTTLLKESGVEQHINSLMVTSFGTGLGTGLGYRVKNGGKVEYKFDPFVVNGKHRVAVYGDANNENLEIASFGILDSGGKEIYNIPAKDAYHFKYSNPDGNPAFGTNGLLAASKWLNLKYSIMDANERIYTTGMQASYLVGVDAGKMQKQGASPESVKNAINRLIEDLKQGNGIQNKNRLIATPVPLTWQNIQMNNSEMRSQEMLDLINREIFYAFKFDKAILEIESSKYNNAEQAMDHLYQSLKAFIHSVERYVETYLLANLDPKFDNSRFIFRIPRQFSEEEIRIKEVKDRETQMYFGNLKVANESFAGMGVVVLPTETQLSTLQEQGYSVYTPAKEDINLSPSSESGQLADNFTGVTDSESVKRLSTENFWELTKEKVDKSFRSLYENSITRN